MICYLKPDIVMASSCLAWVDTEYTHFHHPNHMPHLLEIAIVITSDDTLDERARHSWVVALTPEAEKSLDPVTRAIHSAKRKHGAPSLLDQCRMPQALPINEIEGQIIALFRKMSGGLYRKLRLAGSSINIDKQILTYWMPTLASELFHHQVLDATSCLLMARSLYGHHLLDMYLPRPSRDHCALDDALSSRDLVKALRSLFVPIDHLVSSCAVASTTSGRLFA
jgi:oligoribonuclease (3'-5' exoribonuclease)